MNLITERKVGFFAFKFYADADFNQIRLTVGDREIYTTPLFGSGDELMRQMIMLCFAEATEAMGETSQAFVRTINGLEAQWNGCISGNPAADTVP